MKSSLRLVYVIQQDSTILVLIKDVFLNRLLEFVFFLKLQYGNRITFNN